MPTSPYSARVSSQLAAERARDDARATRAETARLVRRQAFQMAADWLEGVVITAIDRCVAASGGTVQIDCRNNFASDGQDAYKNAHVVFSIRGPAGAPVTEYEVFVAHGLVSVHRIRNHMRQPVIVRGFAGPQLVGAASGDFGAAIVRQALEQAQRGA